MPSLNGNYIDLIIIFVVLYYVYLSHGHKFWNVFSDLVSFVGSVIVSTIVFRFVSKFINLNFNLGLPASNLIGFILSIVILEFSLSSLMYFLTSQFLEKLKISKLLNYLSFVVGIMQGLIVCIFFVNLTYYLPIKPNIKVDIEYSKIANFILIRNQKTQDIYNEIFDPSIFDSLSYLTVKPEEDKRINLDVKKLDLTVDQNSEKEVFEKINSERSALAISKLTYSNNLSVLAEEYAMDMWKRKYFSHYSPEGQNVGDRLKENKIKYTYAGENLALAPTVAIAHNGLMNSEGHRKNILETKFTKVGVGVVDNGVYGKIFVQVFTD